MIRNEYAHKNRKFRIMQKTYICKIFIVLILLQGCKNVQKVADTTKKYVRQPIVEKSKTHLETDGLLIDAKTQYELGNTEKALELYKNIIVRDPNYAVAYYELGGIYYENGRMDSAVYYTEKANKLMPNNLWYQLQLADIYKNMMNASKSIQVMSEIVKQNPDILEYYYELANTYIMDNRILEAIDVFNQVEKRTGISEPISLQKQKLWEAIGKTDKAIKEIENLAAAFPQEKKYNAILAELFMSQKDYAKAFKSYNQILTTDPNDEYIHISLANYYKQTNQQKKAYEELKTGFTNSTLSMKEKIQILGSFYTNEEFYGSQSQYAFELLDALMKQNPDTITMAVFYGDVLMRQRKYKEAAIQFNNHLKRDSSQFEVWEALLICESEIPDNDERLLNLSNRAINLFPVHSLPYYLKGVVYLKNEKYEEAIVALQEGQKWGFQNKYLEAEFYSLLAEAFYRVKEYEKSDKHFDKYLELNPDDMGVLNNYAYYLSERNEQLEKAEHMSKKTIAAEPKNPTFLDTYAWILYRMGKYTEAERYIKLAIDNDAAKSATLFDHYGDILYKNKQQEKAKNYWKKALELDNENVIIKNKLENGIE